MRAFFLGLLILCEILIAATHKSSPSDSALSLLASMIVVVIVAFTFSAILNNIKTITLTRNYSISGIIGVVIGIFFYLWVDKNIIAMLQWLENYGLYFLLILIFISAIVLYFFKGQNKVEKQNDKNVPSETISENG